MKNNGSFYNSAKCDLRPSKRDTEETIYSVALTLEVYIIYFENTVGKH